MVQRLESEEEHAQGYSLRSRKRAQHENPDTCREIMLSPTCDTSNDGFPDIVVHMVPTNTTLLHTFPFPPP